MKQAMESDWKEVAYPINLCVLPFYPDELREKYGLEFFRYWDDGLGEMESTVVDIEGSLFWLKCPAQQLEVGTCVFVRSYEADRLVALSKILKAFGIDESALKWKTDYLGMATYILSRLDDNGNETEMFRFHDEKIAQIVRERYEAKGHKQTYTVKNAT